MKLGRLAWTITPGWVQKDQAMRPFWLAITPNCEPPLAGAGAPAGVPPPQAPAGPAPGWFDDPHGQARLRWWDGQRWTDQTSA